MGEELAQLIPNKGSYGVSVEVLEGKVGEQFNIKQSPDGEIWKDNFLQKTCVLDVDLMCSFQAKRLGYFAVLQI
ncbi:MAG: hypothetical protein WCJ45_06885 [bacterium]